MQLAEAYPQLSAEGAEILAISMDGIVSTAQMAAYAGAQFPLLSDPEGTVVRDYGVYNLLGDSLAAPATFIVRSDMTIAWRHVGKDVADRPEPADIRQQIRELAP